MVGKQTGPPIAAVDGDMVERVRALIIVDVQNDFARVARCPSPAAPRWPAPSTTICPASPATSTSWLPRISISTRGPLLRAPGLFVVLAAALRRRKSGAEFRPDLDTRPIEAIFRKGAHAAAYSGFEGADENGTVLLEWLWRRGVDEVDVVGIATDHCVRRTAEDATRNGLRTRVLVDLTAAVAPSSVAQAMDEMRSAGIELIEGI